MSQTGLLRFLVLRDLSLLLAHLTEMNISLLRVESYVDLDNKLPVFP